MTEPTLLQLALSSIRPSATNPRKSYDRDALADLAASIEQTGLQVPLLVRPLKDADGDTVPEQYELVAGERRLRALTAMGWEKPVPCLVREMSDVEAWEAQIVENLQRADVPALEEAEAFEALLGQLGTIAAVAARLGKEEGYVAKRLRLCSLTLHARDALRERLITIDHALLLARLAVAEQDAALKWTLDRNAGSKTTVEAVVSQRTEWARACEAGEKGRYRWEPESVVRLKAHIEAESGVLLSRAPWNLQQDSLLEGVGPCATCAKNTRANSPLFGDLEMGEAKCTDGAQFAAKTAAFVQIVMQLAGHDEAVKPKRLVARLSWKRSSVKPSIVPNDLSHGEIANPSKVLKLGQWVEAKAGSCRNVRAGVTVDWSDDGERGYMGDRKPLRKPGEALQVCLAVGCKVHPKEWEKAKSAGHQAERRDPEAEKRRAEERAHVEKEETAIRSRVLHTILLNLDAAKTIHLLADRQRTAAGWRKQLLSVMPEVDALTLDFMVIFCADVEFDVRVNGYQLMQPGGVKGDRARLFELAQRMGVDAAQVVAAHFHEAGSIAPWSERLYPKGLPWPKGGKAATGDVRKSGKAAKKGAAKKSKKQIPDGMTNKKGAAKKKAGKA